MGSVTLNNGVKMPKLSYGVYQVDPAGCERCVLDAISVGCRSIGTAQAYNNEEGVGAAIGASNFYPDRLIPAHRPVPVRGGDPGRRPSGDPCVPAAGQGP